MRRNIARAMTVNIIGQPIEPNIPVRCMNTSPPRMYNAIIMTGAGLKSTFAKAELTSFLAIPQAESGTFSFAAQANQLAEIYASCENSSFAVFLSSDQ